MSLTVIYAELAKLIWVGGPGSPMISYGLWSFPMYWVLGGRAPHFTTNQEWYCEWFISWTSTSTAVIRVQADSVAGWKASRNSKAPAVKARHRRSCHLNNTGGFMDIQPRFGSWFHIFTVWKYRVSCMYVNLIINYNIYLYIYNIYSIYNSCDCVCLCTLAKKSF